MPQRIPHSQDIEVRQAFQRAKFQTDVLSTGAVDEILVGQGVGVLPIWTTLVTTDEKVGVDSGATAGYLGAAYNDGILRTGAPLTYTDGGDFITLDVDETAIDHNVLANYAANQHVVLPGTITAVLSDHNLAAHTALGLFDASSDVDHDATTNTHNLTTDVDHDTIANTHNLTTDIDHNQLTNYTANRHIDWTAASDNFSTTGTLTFSPNGHLFRDSPLRSAGSLTLQALTSGSYFFLDLYTKDGDGTDDMGIYLVPLGSPTSLTNFEALEIKWDVSDGEFRIATLEGGSGVVRPINIFAKGHRGQLLLNTDGSVSMGGALAVTGNITGPNVSSGADPGHTHTAYSTDDVKVGIDSGATAGYLGAAFNDGVLRTSTGISYADGGDFVTLTTNDGEIDHDSLLNYVANQHIDWTNATDNFLTDGTLALTTGSISVLFRDSTPGGTDCRLALQGQTSGKRMMLDIYTKDGDGTDDTGVTVFGRGSPTSWTNIEVLEFRWDVSASKFTINTGNAGSGSARAISIYTPGNVDQLLINTDGSIYLKPGGHPILFRDSSPGASGRWAIQNRTTGTGLFLL